MPQIRMRSNTLSLARLEANRLNALKSTGPKTAAGKARSSMNALKHGLRAEHAVIPGEDPEEYQAFADWFYDGCAPESPLEICLVRQMINAEWRLRRAERIENGSMFLSMELEVSNFVLPEKPEQYTPEFDQIAGRCHRAASYAYYPRYVQTFHNMFQRSMRAFLALRKERERQRGRGVAKITKTRRTNPTPPTPTLRYQPHTAADGRPPRPPHRRETSEEVA